MATSTLTKNTTYYTIALTVQKILAFIYFWFISNNLFPEELGQYVFALSFTTLFSILIDIGLSPVLTREASRSQDKANSYLRNIIGIKIPLALFSIIVVWLIINLTGKSDEVRLLVYLASIVMALDSFSLSFWVIFRARQILFYESIATILVQIIIFVLGIIALFTMGSVIYLMLALLTASIFNFLLSLILLKLKLKFSLLPTFNPLVIKHVLNIAPAFAVAGIFVKIYNTSDAVLLGFLAGDAAVGFFAIPAKVIFALQQIIPAAFAAVIYPAFSSYYKHSKHLLTRTFEKSMTYLTMISLPITAGIFILVPEIIKTVWPSYQAVIPTFYVMTLAVPFIFLAFPTGYLLNACDHQWHNTANRGIVTLLAIVLNILLIPRLGFLGAGVTFLVTNVALLALDAFWVRKVVSIASGQLTKRALVSLIAALVMALIVFYTKAFVPLLIVMMLGTFIYAGSLIALRGVSLGELRTIVKKGLR